VVRASENSEGRVIGRAATLARGSLTAALLVGLATAATRYRIRTSARQSRLEPSDAILVFGAALWSDGPSTALAHRLGNAARLYRAGLATRIACYGGEAEVRAMRRFLLADGIPAQALHLDSQGTTTRRAVSAAQRQGWRRVTVVSSPYHVHRILGECRRQRLTAQASPSVLPSKSTLVWPWLERQYAREIAAVWWYWLTGWLMSDRRTPGT